MKSKSPLGELIIQYAGDMTISETASKIGISQSYLSEIMNGRKIPEIDVCNKIADRLNIPRIQIYRILGWFNNQEDDKETFEELLRLAQNDPDLKELVKIYTKFETSEQRHTAIRILQALLRNEDKASK